MAMAEMLTHFGFAELKLLEVLNFTPVPSTSEREASVSPCWLLSMQHSCDVLEHPLKLGAHIFSRPDILFQTMGLTGWAWLGKEEMAYRSNTGGHCLRQPAMGKTPLLYKTHTVKSLAMSSSATFIPMQGPSHAMSSSTSVLRGQHLVLPSASLVLGSPQNFMT